MDRIEQKNYKAAALLKTRVRNLVSREGKAVQHPEKLLFPFMLVCPTPQRRKGGLGCPTEPQAVPDWWLLMNVFNLIFN